MNSPKFMGVLVCGLALLAAGCSRQSAEDKAKEMATEKIDMAKGIGDVLQDKGTAAAESVTTGVGKVLRGVERGVEKSSRQVVLSESAQKAGLQATKVQLADAGTGPASSDAAQSAAGHAIDVYLVTSHDVAGTLKVRALNALEQEIARAKLPIKQSADDGRYARIPMPEQLDVQAVSTLEIDFAPAADK